MTIEQINAMVVWYAYKCRSEFPDEWTTIDNIDVYDDEQKDQAAAEVAHYRLCGYLPAWAKRIERVKVEDDRSFTFIHADI